MTIHVHVHIHGDPRLDEVIRRLKAIEKKEDIEMSLTDDLTAAVTKNTSVVESAKLAITGLIQKVKDLSDQLAAGTIDVPTFQSQLAQLNSESDSLAAAIPASTPADPAAPVPPAA